MSDNPTTATVTLYLRRGERWWGSPGSLWDGRIVNWRKFKRLERKARRGR